MRLMAFQGDVSRNRVVHVLEQLGNTPAPDGIFVNSKGGEFEFFSVLGPALQKRAIVTLAGNVESAAVMLFLLGHRRYALPDATFFFHEIYTVSDAGGMVTIADLNGYMEREREMGKKGSETHQEWLRGMRMAQSWFADFVGQRLNLRPAVILDLMRQEATLEARDAVRYGLVHRIIPHREALGTFKII